MAKTATNQQYVVCVRNEACEDLEVRKIYRLLPDKRASLNGYVRVIDESGEDYLYPEAYFVRVKLPQKAQKAVAASA
ncbi:MAG TPA: hypothetical protein DCM87_16040 [Planctomycetes bacterium]|jgi:hypothetical protein|nr:hypothetical protein [Planctomycetota bacterium]